MTPAAIVRSSSWFLRHTVIDFVVLAGARDRLGCVVTICGAPVDRAQRIHQTPPNTSTTRPPSHRPPRTRNDCTHTHTHRYAPPGKLYTSSVDSPLLRRTNFSAFLPYHSINLL